jgi:DNA polymerase
MDPISLNSKEDNFTDVLPDNLDALHSQMAQCHLCDLSKTRQRVLTGFGNTQADLMIIDAYPSMSEDESGDSFSGRAGSSLKKMVENVIGLNINSIYLTHILKCKPSHQHKVLDSELSSCKPYLLKQIELIKPKIVVTLGEVAYYYLSGDDSDLSEIRGRVHSQNDYKLVATFHPNYLLRNPSAKKYAFDDLKLIKELMN